MTGLPKPGVPKFDWDNDKCVIVHGQPAIAVFENVRGNIAVLEECGRVVEIPPEHATRIVEAILKAAGLPAEAVKGSHDERPRDRTAADSSFIIRLPLEEVAPREAGLGGNCLETTA